MSDTEAQQFISFVLSCEPLAKRKNIGYHIVYKEGVRTNFCSSQISSLTFFPQLIITINNFSRKLSWAMYRN
jgi:hypothetical protein